MSALIRRSFPLTTQLESQYAFYRPAEGRRLSRYGWPVTYRDDLPARGQSPVPVTRIRERNCRIMADGDSDEVCISTGTCGLIGGQRMNAVWVSWVIRGMTGVT